MAYLANYTMNSMSFTINENPYLKEIIAIKEKVDKFTVRRKMGKNARKRMRRIEERLVELSSRKYAMSSADGMLIDGIISRWSNKCFNPE